jgi:hypothetical protein
MISAHDADGLLPIGIHTATWGEVADRFGWSARRRILLARLRAALGHLADAGCTTAWLGGSFVSAKAEPGDVDVVWSVEGVDLSRVHPMFRLIDRALLRMVAAGDYFPSQDVEGETGLPFVEFFQTTRDGRRVGIVEVDLTTLP